MSRGILYASLALLVGVLCVISFTLQKETSPPPPPSEQATQAQQQQSNETKKKMMANQMQTQQKKMQEMIKMHEKTSKMASGKAAHVNKGMQISGKWYEYGKDGAEGIAHPVPIPEEKPKVASSTPKPAMALKSEPFHSSTAVAP